MSSDSIYANKCVLSADEFERFLKICMEPHAPNDKMKAAAQHYRDWIMSQVPDERPKLPAKGEDD